MELGYYTDRLNYLDKREDELQGQLVTSRLSLKSIKKEKENIYEAMNKTTFESPFKQVDYEDKIKELSAKLNEMIQTDKEKSVLIKHLQSQISNQKKNEKTIKKVRDENKTLKKKIKTLNGRIGTLNMVIGKLENKEKIE